VTRGVAFDDEHPVEVGQLEHRRRCERVLESPEGRLSLGGPSEAFFLEQASERCSDVVVAHDETSVVSDKAEEGTNRPDGTRHRPVDHRLDLLMIHGHPFCRDHVAQIGHRLCTELALRQLHEKLMFLQLGQDEANVAKMLGPR
jgi:hypothetical protein